MDFFFMYLFLATMLGSTLTFAYERRSQIWHWIKFKKICLPCPTCNGTGEVKASNPTLLRMMQQGANPEIINKEPGFPCSQCDGDKVVCEYYPRGHKVEIEEGKTIGNHTQNPPA